MIIVIVNNGTLDGVYAYPDLPPAIVTADYDDHSDKPLTVHSHRVRTSDTPITEFATILEAALYDNMERPTDHPDKSVDYAIGIALKEATIPT